MNRSQEDVIRLGGWRCSHWESQDGARLKAEEFVLEMGHKEALEHIR